MTTTASCRQLAVAAAGALALSTTALAAPASADPTFHTARFALSPVDGQPLRSGTVIDIHAQGPRVYAHERYHLSGARPGTTYQVVLRIHADTGCAPETSLVELPTATLVTNRAGNAHGGVTFTPADAAGLAGQEEYGLVWDVVGPDGVAYSTGCQVVQID